MIRPVFGAVLVLLQVCIASADTGFLDRSVTINGERYRYQVYVPSSYSSERAWPVIVDLHGNGAQGDDGIRQTAHFLPEQIRLASANFPFVVVFPQAPRGATWTASPVQEMVIAQLDATTREFNVDAARVFLTGFSMGGTGVYAIASRWPERFAALVAIAASPPAMVAVLAERIRQVPCWVVHGESDERVPVSLGRNVAAALREVGAPVRFTEYERTDHGGSAERAYAEPDFVSWLLSRHR